MSIYLERPRAYEHLLMVINEFEKQALESNTRTGVLAASYAPVKSMNAVLETSKRALTVSKNPELSEDEDSNNKVFKAESQGKLGSQDNKLSASFDADIGDLLGDDDSKLRRYVEECLGCNTRVTADWQIKPVSLIGPINGFIDQIKGSLNMFEARLDPFDNLKDICVMLNSLEGLCLHDMLLVLMSLKMLLKKYLTNAFQIKLDWTTVLGPLLKAIVQGISVLLDIVGNAALGPLDCTLNSMNASNALFKEGQGLANAVQAIGQGKTSLFEDLESGNIDKHIDGGTTVRDIRWVNENSDRDGFGKIKVEERINSTGRQGKGKGRGKSSPAVSLPTGFQLNADVSLEDALSDPRFVKASPLEKLILPVQEFKKYLAGLIKKIQGALDSLENLVGQGLSLNLNNMGIILYILDMLSLQKLMIKMLSLNPGVKDWCTFLEENPEFLEQHLRNQYNNVRVSADREKGVLVLARGPNTVGVIPTCSRDRSQVDNQLIAQWVNELKTKGM